MPQSETKNSFQPFYSRCVCLRPMQHLTEIAEGKHMWTVTFPPSTLTLDVSFMPFIHLRAFHVSRGSRVMRLHPCLSESQSHPHRNALNSLALSWRAENYPLADPEWIGCVMELASCAEVNEIKFYEHSLKELWAHDWGELATRRPGTKRIFD